MKKLLFYFLLLISGNLFAQKIVCDNADFANAYNLAINTVDINVRRGILAAGTEYGGEWTRDISINSWNGVSLLRPKVAMQSLWSVTVNKDSIGHQYWDKMLWAIAAYNHYQVTGDKEFLKQAYICSGNTMRQLEHYAFDGKYGLFMGPSVFNDGIAAYPEPIYEPLNFSGGVLDHKGSYQIKCLSTNCVYYGAYIALSSMGSILNVGKSFTAGYLHKAAILKKNILANFYNKEKNTFSYLIDQNGKIANYQEGLGISFAVMFGILDGEKANQLIGNAVVSKYGITSVSPDFPRYSAEKPGRHNNIIWPMVNGFFANAAVVAGNYKSFATELNGLTRLALDEDKGNYDFREIFNPYSGKPDGGYQAWGEERPNYHWASCMVQTWSATAYINMINYGVAGIRMQDNFISFSPYLPQNVHYLQLSNINYRGSVLKIIIKGNGSKIKSFLLNGIPSASHQIDAKIKGANEIRIEMEN